MVKRFLKFMHKDEKGITGLETAIILIAFVVVAAVFAFTALSAGLFSTEKSKEAVYSGLKEAQSTMELKGNVVAMDGTANQAIDYVTFTVALTAGGEPIDFAQPTDAGADGIADTGSANKVIVNTVSQNWEVTNLYWTKTAIGKSDGDNLLEQGEQFLLTIGDTDGTGDLEDALSLDTLTANEQFTIQVVPPTGATLVVEKTLPGIIDAVNNLN